MNFVPCLEQANEDKLHALRETNKLQIITLYKGCVEQYITCCVQHSMI